MFGVTCPTLFTGVSSKGLSVIMNKPVSLGVFSRFRIWVGGMILSHLHYPNGIVLGGEPQMENLLTIKAILRSFELVSGLKVIFPRVDSMRLM